MHHTNSSMTEGKSVNPFEANDLGMTFNVMLQFQYANAQGADIYKEPMGRFAVKIADVLSTRHMNPWVNYQADMYMGEDGARYEVTEYPENVDIMGALPRSEQMDPKHDPHPDPAKLRTSDNPGVSSLLFNELFPNLRWEKDKGNTRTRNANKQWVMQNEIPVTKVFQDDHIQEVFHDAYETYYATTKHANLELPVTHVVVVERLEGSASRIRR